MMETSHAVTDEKVVPLATVEDLVARFLWATKDMANEDELDEAQAAEVLKTHGFGEGLINEIINKSIALREARLGPEGAPQCNFSPWRFLLAKRDQTSRSSKPPTWSVGPTSSINDKQTDADAHLNRLHGKNVDRTLSGASTPDNKRPPATSKSCAGSDVLSDTASLLLRSHPTKTKAKQVTWAYPLQHQEEEAESCVESSSQKQEGAGEAMDYRSQFLSILESQNHLDLAWRAAKRQPCQCKSLKPTFLLKFAMQLLGKTQNDNVSNYSKCDAPRSQMRRLMNACWRETACVSPVVLECSVTC